MPKRLTELSVFISCPSNLNDLRGIAEAAIREISDIARTTLGITLRPISWRDDLVPGVGDDGQQVINAQTVGKYDIYLGMVGDKFGTKTPRAGSGTEEEFDLALQQYRSNPSTIRLLFYLQAFGVNPLSIEPEELSKVLVFKRKLQEQGVFYKELVDLDDALKSFKSHLLKTLADDWDTTNNLWRIPLPAEQQDGQRISIALVDQAFANPVSDAEDDSDPGLFDMYVAGTGALEKTGLVIQKLTENLNVLTEKTRGRFDNINVELGPSGVVELVNSYAADMDNFVSVSKGDLANASADLSKGADQIELFYKISHELGLSLAEPPTVIIEALDTIEPSLKLFRDAALSAKVHLGSIPPMTSRLKISQNSIINLFDKVALEVTLIIERLSLLRLRLKVEL